MIIFVNFDVNILHFSSFSIISTLDIKNTPLLSFLQKYHGQLENQFTKFYQHHSNQKLFHKQLISEWSIKIFKHIATLGTWAAVYGFLKEIKWPCPPGPRSMLHPYFYEIKRRTCFEEGILNRNSHCLLTFNLIIFCLSFY